MEVICDKYKTCKLSETCSHSKPHELRTIADDFFDDCGRSIMCDSHEQNCNSKSLRKFKLEKLNQQNDK